MKKLVLSLFLALIAFTSWAGDNPSDLVIIYNSNPGTETADDDATVIFYDAQGRQMSVTYTYNATTNTLNITGGNTGICYVVITNKKTKKTTTVRLMVVNS